MNPDESTLRHMESACGMKLGPRYTRKRQGVLCMTILSPPNTWAGGSGCDPEAAACCSTLRALSTTGTAAAIGLIGAAVEAGGFSCWLLLLSPT